MRKYVDMQEIDYLSQRVQSATDKIMQVIEDEHLTFNETQFALLLVASSSVAAIMELGGKTNA